MGDWLPADKGSYTLSRLFFLLTLGIFFLLTKEQGTGLTWLSIFYVLRGYVGVVQMIDSYSIHMSVLDARLQLCST
jgi:hypothetical protein